MIELLDELYNTMNEINNGFIMDLNNNQENVDCLTFADCLAMDCLATDIYETKDNYVLEIEVPGFKKENVNLDVEKGILTVTVKNDNNNKKHHFLRKERNNKFYFERRFEIGSYTNEDITASMNDGLLTVLLPKEVKKIENKKYIEIK